MSQETPSGATPQKQRNYFRVEYPIGARPTFKMRTKTFPIINLSEGGMLLCLKDTNQPGALGMRLQGEIRFGDKDSLAVKGCIIRLSDDSLAVLFSDDGVSFQKIMAEQRALLTRYGTLKRPQIPES